MNGTWRPVVAVGAMMLALVWSVAGDLSHADRAAMPLPLVQQTIETIADQQ
jgi:hypothetical protein